MVNPDHERIVKEGAPLIAVWRTKNPETRLDLFASNLSEANLCGAIRTLIEKGKDAEVKNVKLETLEEGRCVQMLHIGPYDAVAEPIAAMRTHATDQGLKFHGDHHEIYLSDPRRIAPDRLRTILRRPVKPAGR